MRRWSKARFRYQIVLYHGVALFALLVAAGVCVRATRLDPPPGTPLSAQASPGYSSVSARMGTLPQPRPAFDPISMY